MATAKLRASLLFSFLRWARCDHSLDRQRSFRSRYRRLPSLSVRVFVLSLVDGSRSQCRVVGVVLQIFIDGAWRATMKQVGVGMTGPSPYLPFLSFSSVLNSLWSFRFSRPVLYLINNVWTTRAAQDLPRWTQSRAVPVTISCDVIGVVPTLSLIHI